MARLPLHLKEIDGETAIVHGSEWLTKNKGRTSGIKNGQEFLVSDVVYIKAVDKYAEMRMEDGSVMLMATPVASMSRVLDMSEWLKVAHGCLVRRSAIVSVVIGVTAWMNKVYHVKVEPLGHELEISRRMIREARDVLAPFFERLDSERQKARWAADREMKRLKAEGKPARRYS